MTAQSEGFTRYRRWDFDGDAARGVPAAAALSRTTCSTRARWSSRPTSSSPSTSAATTSRPSRSGATSTTTRPSPCATRRCRRRSRRSSPPRSGHLDLAYDYFRETALVDLRDLAGQHRRRPAPRRAGRRLAGRGRRVRRPARPRRRRSRSRRACRRRSPAALPAAVPRPAPARRHRSRRRSLRAARRRAARRCSTTASRSPWHPHRRRHVPCPALAGLPAGRAAARDGLLASAAWAPTLPTRGSPRPTSMTAPQTAPPGFVGVGLASRGFSVPGLVSKRPLSRKDKDKFRPGAPRQPSVQRMESPVPCRFKDHGSVAFVSGRVAREIRTPRPRLMSPLLYR